MKTWKHWSSQVRLTAILSAMVAIAMPAVADAAHPNRGDDSSRSSKNGKLEAVVDGVGVTLTYGRPKAKGRQIWGGLVPYGKVWRAGADEATAITFAKDVKVEGKTLKAGTYGMFVMPEKSGVTLIFNSQAEQWGAYSYEASKDVLRVKVNSKKSKHTEELEFINAGKTIELRWGKLVVPFSVSKT
ncbi:MAG: DUF2911 domain-containing protein [Myxococcota bacterium]